LISHESVHFQSFSFGVPVAFVSGEGKVMKTKLIVALLLASSAVFAGPRIAIGVGIGIPAAPAYYASPVPVPVYAPPVYAPPPAAYVAPALRISRRLRATAGLPAPGITPADAASGGRDIGPRRGFTSMPAADGATVNSVHLNLCNSL
jgi:hypothetical protein